MAGKDKLTRIQSVEGRGDNAVAKALSETKIEQKEPTGRDLVDGSLPQGVLNELKPGAVVQKNDYVVKIVSLEAGYRRQPSVRYKKGFLNPDSGKLEWGPEVLGNREQIEKWLLKGA